MHTDPRFAPWRAEALRRGYASSISVPLLAHSRAFGAMTIYSREPDSFSDEEVDLLASLASDLAYGITSIRTRLAHTQAEAALRRTHDELELRIEERTQELARANAELRLQMAAVRAAANGIVISDREGNVRWCNPAFTQMTGYTYEEILNQNIRLLKSGEQSLEFYQRLWETILAGQIWHGELINRRKDGTLYVEEQTIAPVLNEQGQIANFVAVKQDVTDRKRAEDHLKQNNLDLLALSKAEHDLRQLAETLAAANSALAQSLNLETVLETLLDCVERLVPYDSANVMLLESESRLAVQVTHGYERWSNAEKARIITFDVQTNLVLKDLLATRQSQLVPDTSLEPGWEIRPGAEHVRSWLGVPLVAGGNVIGLYSLDKAEPGFFTLEHVRLAEMLVGQAAVAIQNAWLYEQVRAGRERLQSLSRRLVEVQEAERQYVARELHDEAGQALTSLLFGLNQVEQQTENPTQAAQIIELKEMTNNIIESLHRLAMDLRPASLDYLGLIPALQQQVKTVGVRHGLIAQFKAVGLEGERLPPEVETALYRIVQEALTNIIRHAQATRIDVLLERRGDRVVVVVEDNGCGFEVQTDRFTQEGHLGLAGMQERAEFLGGAFIIESTAGIGTTLVVEVPYGDSNSGRG
jgi:PAS domain S-box-containing protein